MKIEALDLILVILLFTALIYFYLSIQTEDFYCIYGVCFYLENLLRKISIIILLEIFISFLLIPVKSKEEAIK